MVAQYAVPIASLSFTIKGRSHLSVKWNSLSIFSPASMQQMTIAVVRHPFRASKMGVERTASTFRFSHGIDVQDEARRLAPIGVIGLGVQQAQIGDNVFLVIHRQDGIIGSRICNIGIERRRWH